MAGLSWSDLDVLAVEGAEGVDAELESELEQADADAGNEQGSSVPVQARTETSGQGDEVTSSALSKQNPGLATCLFGSGVEEVDYPQVKEEVDFFYSSQADRLIKDKDPACPGFPGFWGCHWTNGKIYPFGSPVVKKVGVAPGASPTGTMVEQDYVGSENMASTYRLLCKFQSADGAVFTGTGSAVALSPHTLVTAGNNLQYSVNGVPWILEEVLVLAGEYVPVRKVAKFGYRCEVLSQESHWGSATECPRTGADIGFLRVKEVLPCWLLPCSPSPGVLLSSFGFPCAADFLSSAVRELRQESLTGPVWAKYRDLMLEEIQDLAAVLGDFRAAELETRKLLLSYFQVALRGMPDGVQACSAGQVETLTDAFIAHACPSLPGFSGGALCDLRRPGYFVGCHVGGIPPNTNIATSADNSKFVDCYMSHVVCELPPPHSTVWSRPFFTIQPFREWIERHKDKLPSNCCWLPNDASRKRSLSPPRADPRSGKMAKTTTDWRSLTGSVVFEPEVALALCL